MSCAVSTGSSEQKVSGRQQTRLDREQVLEQIRAGQKTTRRKNQWTHWHAATQTACLGATCTRGDTHTWSKYVGRDTRIQAVHSTPCPPILQPPTQTNLQPTLQPTNASTKHCIRLLSSTGPGSVDRSVESSRVDTTSSTTDHRLLITSSVRPSVRSFDGSSVR